MPSCPYCGEEQKALKNHVRLSSGNGHGPSGEYPDDFDAGGPERRASAHRSGRDGGGDESPSDADGPAEAGRETVDMTHEEFDRKMAEAIEGARETAYAEGYDDGYADGRADAGPEGASGETGATETLPCCGNEVPKGELPDGHARIRCAECGEVLALTA